MSETSIADIIALLNGGNGMGGNGIIVLILLIFLLGRNGILNGSDYGQYATAASQQDILFSSKFQALDNKIDRIGNGIADATFALKDSVVTEGRATQTAVGQNRFDLANYFAQLNDNINNKFAKMELDNERRYSRSLEGRINQLEMQSAMCGVVRYPMQTTYNSGGNPFCGCNNGCGNGY